MDESRPPRSSSPLEQLRHGGRGAEQIAQAPGQDLESQQIASRTISRRRLGEVEQPLDLVVPAGRRCDEARDAAAEQVVTVRRAFQALAQASEFFPLHRDELPPALIGLQAIDRLFGQSLQQPDDLVHADAAGQRLGHRAFLHGVLKFLAGLVERHGQVRPVQQLEGVVPGSRQPDL